MFTSNGPEPDAEWYYAGNSTVNGSENRIKIPDGVFEAEILERKYDRGHWSFESVTGIIVISNDPLKEDQYKYQDGHKIGGEGDAQRCTIPKIFFNDYKGKGGPLPERAQVEYGEERHFVYRDGMDSGDVRSCYVLNREQLVNTISEPDDWEGSFDTIPRFIS